ncbi:MAG TPA: hypothetical protein VH143_07660 [Kofleriaceae bacterium]|jgi:hypothetical protein|nr:hypothetical protein [Kofleriaceae bacterium]
MSEPTCDLVAERIALGEPLAELDAHVTSCDRCKQLATLPSKLGGTGHAADPGIGFSSRVTAGAQHRIIVRRRRRVAAAGALSVAAAALLTVVALHQPSASDGVAFQMPNMDRYKPALSQPHHDQPSENQREADPDVRTLVHLANAEHHTKSYANWGRIEKRLRPYAAVLEGKQQ